MDDMSDATTPGSTPRPGLPATYSDAGPATPTTDARPGLEPVTIGIGPLTVDEVVAGRPRRRPGRAWPRRRWPRCAAPAR